MVAADTNGCKDSTGQLTVVVFKVPKVTLNIKDSTICQGDTLLVKATSDSVMYRWSNGLRCG